MYRSLHEKGADKYVPINLIEQYAMCYARWIQCEKTTNKLGFIARHPITNKPIASPFVQIGIDYMNQANKLYDKILSLIPHKVGVNICFNNPIKQTKE